MQHMHAHTHTHTHMLSWIIHEYFRHIDTCLFPLSYDRAIVVVADVGITFVSGYVCVCVFLFVLAALVRHCTRIRLRNKLHCYTPCSDGDNNNYTNTGENPSISMTQAFYDSSFFIVVIVVGRIVSNTNLAQCPLYNATRNMDNIYLGCNHIYAVESG